MLYAILGRDVEHEGGRVFMRDDGLSTVSRVGCGGHEERTCDRDRTEAM